MSEHLIHRGSDHGEIYEVSHEDSYPDDDDPGWVIVRYNVWVKQRPEPEEEDDDE